MQPTKVLPKISESTTVSIQELQAPVGCCNLADGRVGLTNI